MTKAFVGRREFDLEIEMREERESGGEREMGKKNSKREVVLSGTNLEGRRGGRCRRDKRRERERDSEDDGDVRDHEHYWDNHGSNASPPHHHPFRLQAMALPSPFPILPFLYLQGGGFAETACIS